VTSPTFADLGLCAPLARALETLRYTDPTPIQTQAIPQLLEGKDMFGIAQTGTGKTAAFALPILHHLSEIRTRPSGTRAHALILAPTRELVIQIRDSFASYGQNLRMKCTAIVGGVAQGPQRKAMASGTDILVATPGRLLDLINQGHVHLDRVTHFVVDEADRMLDMGFIRDVRKIVAALPADRQSLMFSATMPADVQHLARDMLSDPIRIEVTPKVIAVDRIEQGVIHIKTADKREHLIELLADPALARVIVFTRTKHRANRVTEHLGKAGISADALHGNKSQNARQQALERFRVGKARVLVATDIAARGIDIDDITHVINFELPNEPESYVHRIGRTARAGADGHAISLCDATEADDLRKIERLTGRPLTVLHGTPPAGKTPLKVVSPGGAPKNNRRPGRPRRRKRAKAA
jgi:ATP-dependent RNA helicase RhlE